MHHRKFIRPEKDVNYDSKDGNTKLRKHTNFGYKRDSSNPDKLTNFVGGKPRRKSSNSNLIYESHNQSTVLVNENDERMRTLDFILNFEWRKKNSNNYVSAYFTDSDLNNRKKFHESNSSKTINTLNVELIEDNKCTAKNKNYILNVSKEKKGKVRDGKRKEIEELFRATNPELKSYRREDDIFKDLDRYFKVASKRKNRKNCIYSLSDGFARERTTIFSPEKKCCSINLLLNKQDKNLEFQNDIISDNGVFTNSIDNSSSTVCSRRNFLNERKNFPKYKSTKIKSKHMLDHGRGRGSHRNHFQNDESISVTSEKDSLGSSKSRTSTYSKNFSSDFNMNANCRESKPVYYDNYIYQNPEKLENDTKVNATSTSFYTSHSSKDCDKLAQNSSISSILDYSISKSKQKCIDKSFSGHSSEWASDCTVVNYDLVRKKSKNYQSLRKPSCEILMNRIKKKKSEKVADYRHFKKDRSGKKYSTNDKSKQTQYQFEETCRSYIIDRNLRKYKVRNTRTKSEFIPATRKYSYIASNVNRPNSIEKDILLKTFDEVHSSSSTIYNYHKPFDLRVVDSYKFEFNDDNLTLSQVLNRDESFYKSRPSNDVSLKLSIPNMYVVKEIDNDNSSKKLKRNEKSNHINVFKNNYLPEKEPCSVIKNQMNSVDQDRQPFSSVSEYKNFVEENYEINKLLKKADFFKPNTEVVLNETDYRNSNDKTEEVQVNKETSDKLVDETILIYKSHDENSERNKKIYNKNIEVLFPIKSNRRFSCSHTTVTNRSTLSSFGSSKARFCRSEISKSLEKTGIVKDMPSKKRVLIDEKRNCSINDFAQNEFPIRECWTGINSLNNTEQKKNSSPKICEQVSSKCTDLLNSSKFKSEIEKIVNKYLEKKIIINWLGHKKFNILVFAEDNILKNNPQKLIETLKTKHKQALMGKIKKCSYKLHKFQASCKSTMKNEQTQNIASCSKNEPSNCNQPEKELIPYELVLCDNCLECKNILNASKIKSLPIFNLSKLKIQKRSVTYYSKLSSHSMKVKRYKRKNYNKTGKNKIILNKNKCSKSTNNQRNNLKIKEANNGKINNKPEGSKLFKELNEFKNLLSEVEKKQDSILSFLNLDPCGLLFTFPSSTSVIKKCNRIKRFKIPFKKLSEKVLLSQQLLQSKL